MNHQKYIIRPNQSTNDSMSGSSVNVNMDKNDLNIGMYKRLVKKLLLVPS